MSERKTSFYKEDKKKTIEEMRKIIKELTPCSVPYLKAELELKTGLSHEKVREVMNLFFVTGFVGLEMKKNPEGFHNITTNKKHFEKSLRPVR